MICYHHSYGHLLVRYLHSQSPSHEHISTAVKFVANSTSICTSGSNGSGTNVMIEEKQMRYRNPPQSILLTFISFTPPFPVGDRLIQVWLYIPMERVIKLHLVIEQSTFCDMLLEFWKITLQAMTKIRNLLLSLFFYFILFFYVAN